MLNTSINLGHNSQTVTFNTPSHGMIQRSHPKSRFIRFQKGSDVEKMVFPLSGPSYIREGDNTWDTKYNIEVLQVMIFGDNYYLVEIVETDDLIEGDIETVE